MNMMGDSKNGWELVRFCEDADEGVKKGEDDWWCIQKCCGWWGGRQLGWVRNGCYVVQGRDVCVHETFKLLG